MAEILSQSQIDELLNAMAGGGDAFEAAKTEVAPQDNWKKYDFSSPKKFTKDRLKQLKGVYDNYARLISLQLNGFLRTVCEAEVYNIEEQRYIEFSNMLTENDVMMLLDVKVPGEHVAMPMLFHVSQKLMVDMIDRTLGGAGTDEVIDASYTYTEIELVLYGKIMEYVLAATDSAWANYVQLSLEGQHIEQNPGLFQEISLDEPVVIVLVNMRVGDVEGNITICVPGMLLTSAFAQTDKRKPTDMPEFAGDTTRETIMTSLSNSPLEMVAKLGSATLNLSDVYQMKVGDVIDLNQSSDTDVTLYVQEQPWFEGKLGNYQRNAAVQIERRLTVEEALAEPTEEQIQTTVE